MARETGLTRRICDLCGAQFGAAFDEIGRNTTRDSVEAAVELARATGCDGIVAVGAGSAMVFGRMVAILLGESRSAEEMMTRYAESGPPVSPRLTAPKAPIINVPTAATSAQARAGSAMLDRARGVRMEYFDPKTRPVALFWDSDAVMTAPDDLTRRAGMTIFWWSLMGLAATPETNPLSEGDRRQSFRLASAALGRLDSPGARLALCAAAYLNNRDEDMDGRPFLSHWIVRVCYALGAGLTTVANDVPQGEVYRALTGPAIRHFGHGCPEQLARITGTLGGDTDRDPVEASIASLDRVFDRFGPRLRLRDVLESRSRLRSVTEAALRSYNADPRGELRDHAQALDAVLSDAW